MNRRDLLSLGVASGTAGAAGIGLGYRYHGPLRRLQDKFEAGKTRPANAPREKFRARSRAIQELHRSQTKADVQALKKKGSSGFLVGGQRVAGSSILPTRRRPQSHRSPKGGQEIPKYPTRQSGRGQLVKGIRH